MISSTRGGPLFLTKYIEKAGTETVDMRDRCLNADIPIFDEATSFDIPAGVL